jgi:hypothetical protein
MAKNHSFSLYFCYMKIQLKNTIPVKDFRQYTPRQLQEKAMAQLATDAVDKIEKYQVTQ